MSAYVIACVTVFLVSYVVNTTYMTVFYHRALTHGALTLRPGTRAFVAKTGIWVTGLDPKTWCCMHRLHHLHADTEADPHSPAYFGLFGTFRAQLRSYLATMKGLSLGLRRYRGVVQDLDFPVDPINASGLWFLPYLFHASLVVIAGVFFHSWCLGLAYFTGLLSAPLGGWAVNAFGHSRGYRNFETPDLSRNNTCVALLVFGEGYQNNHHADPKRARFALKKNEWDAGYLLCRLVQALRLGHIACSP